VKQYVTAGRCHNFAKQGFLAPINVEGVVSSSARAQPAHM